MSNKTKGRHRAPPARNAFAYTLKDAQSMGAPGKSRIYELAQQGVLKLIKVPGLQTMIEGDSLRRLLGVDEDVAA